MSFHLPELPFAKDALTPHMSAKTLDFHHGKHHKAYVDKANNLIKGTGLEDKSIEEVIIAAAQDAAMTPLFNNVAQHYNHSLFWNCLGQDQKIPSVLESRLVADFGSIEAFRQTFHAAAVSQFGSGWAWLVMQDDKLRIVKTSNADNPLTHGQKPLLTCDVWEHAYYMDYQNRRPDFVTAFLDHMINWHAVAKRLARLSLDPLVTSGGGG